MSQHDWRNWETCQCGEPGCRSSYPNRKWKQMNEDPIAAHLTELIADAPAPNHEEDNYDAGYVAALADLRDSAAFKLVVEQHTNGRIAETVKSTGQRMYAQTKKWQERAEKAEAERSQIKDALWTIMNQLDSQAEYLGTGDDGTEWINYARNKIQKAYVECGLHLELDAGPAALQGEQQ